MQQVGKSVLLIDSATSGCAGAYIDGIHRHLEHRDAVEVGVSHYFPFDYGKKIFYKYSELSAQPIYKLGRARLYVRFAELVLALFRLLVYVQRANIRIVCYALSSNLAIEYAFLWAVKHLLRAKVYLICHDVVPFVLPGEDYHIKIRKRRKFYVLADRLIVHNDNSMKELRAVFGIMENKIDMFPFPIYDLSRMKLKLIDVLPPTASKRFLFIGHLRSEKGIELLLQAWLRFSSPTQDAELVIAGNIPAGCEYDFAAVEGRKVTLLTTFLTDEQYVNLIRTSDCVVLPYVRGTNSAVVSTVLSLRRNMIVSDIEMFRNNPLIPDESFFGGGDAESLADRLTYFAGLGNNEQLLLGTAMVERFSRYDAQFREQVNMVFDVTAVA